MSDHIKYVSARREAALKLGLKGLASELETARNREEADNKIDNWSSWKLYKTKKQPFLDEVERRSRLESEVASAPAVPAEAPAPQYVAPKPATRAFDPNASIITDDLPEGMSALRDAVNASEKSAVAASKCGNLEKCVLQRVPYKLNREGRAVIEFLDSDKKPYAVAEALVGATGAGEQSDIHPARHETVGGKALAAVIKYARPSESAMLKELMTLPQRVCFPTYFAERDSKDGKGKILSMQKLSGYTLEEVLDAVNGPVPDHIAATIIRRVAYALGGIHSLSEQDGRSKIHRDVKTGNIMLTFDGGVYLIDLGLSAPLKLHPELGQARSGKYGSMQQITLTEAEKVDDRSDIYSLVGPTLYRMLTGEDLIHDAVTAGGLSAQMRANAEHPKGYFKKEIIRKLEDKVDKGEIDHTFFFSPEEIALIGINAKGIVSARTKKLVDKSIPLDRDEEDTFKNVIMGRKGYQHIGEVIADFDAVPEYRFLAKEATNDPASVGNSYVRDLVNQVPGAQQKQLEHRVQNRDLGL